MDPYKAPANSEACGFTPPTTFGMSRRATVVLPGSSRSGEKATKKSFSAFEEPRAALVLFLQNWNHDLLCRARVGCTLEDNQLTGLQMRRNGMRGIGNVAKVG